MGRGAQELGNMNINHTRDLLIKWASPFMTAMALLQKNAQRIFNDPVCALGHLPPGWEDEEDFEKQELFEKLPDKQAKTFIVAAHGPNRALFDLSMAIENLPMHFMRKDEMRTAVTIFEDNLGSCERLLTSPIPLVYTRRTARFLAGWLLLLPFALWEPFGTSWNHLWMLTTTAIISILLFGIEELATQLEEPFTILPMQQAFCDKIGTWCNEIVSWEPDDNAMEVAAEPQSRYGGFTAECTVIAGGGSHSTSEPAATDIGRDIPSA